MAYVYGPFPVWVARNPKKAAFLVLTIGLLGGVVMAFIFPGLNLFERFGAVTTSLGLLVFGSLASELLVRSLGTQIMGNNGQPGGPLKFDMTRHALTLQTWVVLIGTLQWGFGSLVFSR